MNVCLVTGAVSEKSFQSGLPKELVSMGLRVVVLFLRPQASALWSRGGVVYCSAGYPWRYRVTPVLENAISERNIPKSTLPARIVLGVSRRLEGAAGRLLRRVPAVPLSAALPMGPSAYGVFHALDAECEAAARALATEGGAKFLNHKTADVAGSYERLQMDWLEHPCAE